MIARKKGGYVFLKEQEYFIQNLESKIYRTMLKNHFSQITFVCIGSNRLQGDIFGPLVGNELKKRFVTKPLIKVYGTVEEPVHFLNAQKYCNFFEENTCKIAIDSAISPKEKLGNSYVSWGGMPLGKAFHKNFYFPANISIKTVISKQNDDFLHNDEKLQTCKANEIKALSLQVAQNIECAMQNINLSFDCIKNKKKEKM